MKTKMISPILATGLLFSSVFVFALPGTNPSKNKIKYIDKANMDLSVKPGDNFYRYSNGGWLKNNPVPGSKTRWGSFDVLRELSSTRVRTLLEESTKKTNRDRKTQIIGDFYASGMDSATLDAKGYQPIKVDLDRLNNINNGADVLREINILRTGGAGAALFGMNVGPDRKNVMKYIPTITQGGTTLPDKDYYLKDDARSTIIRNAYKKHLQKMFSLAGEDATTAAASAAAVLKIETELANAQLSRIQMRNPDVTYNKFSVKDFNATTPNIDWNMVLKGANILGADSILSGNPAFLKKVSDMLVSVPATEWRSYLRWNLIKSAAPFLSSDFVKADFEFSSVQTGQKEQTPRWQRLSNLIDRMLGDMVGELYIQRYFKPEAKAYVVKMVDNLQVTFANRIKNLDWMSNETKTQALEKLNAIAKKIAYPDKWKEYEGITASKNDFYNNVRNVSKWAYNNNVSRMGKPVNRKEMGMSPPTINASYNETNNDITFPAGILQFPFFDFGADDAVNYGGIAAVIGHEITHGFDDQGRRYDAVGNLKDWWTKPDAAKFKSKADEVVAQYNSYTVLDTLHVKGELTLGENLADLGGLNMAYEAFTKTKQFKEGKKIDGFTPQQRFFLSWAQIWRNNVLPENAAQLVRTDVHSPGIHRANGPVTNIDAWYDAFNIKEGDKMYKPKEQRTRIW
jgi:putative endopeptidase